MLRKTRERVGRFWASLALLSAEMLVIMSLLITSVIAFVYVTRRIFLVGNEHFDFRVFDFLSQYVNETNNNIMLVITFFGTHEFLIPANLILIAYFLFIKKHKWYSIKLPAIAISSLLMMFILKNLFGRERPLIPLLHEASGLSFPSGHALMSVTFYGLLIFIVWHTVKNNAAKWSLISFLIIWIFLIGFSRIYLKVHYTTDVIAGFAVGFLWLVVSIWILKRMEKYSKRKIDPVVETAPVADAPEIKVDEENNKILV